MALLGLLFVLVFSSIVEVPQEEYQGGVSCSSPDPSPSGSRPQDPPPPWVLQPCPSHSVLFRPEPALSVSICLYVCMSVRLYVCPHLSSFLSCLFCFFFLILPSNKSAGGWRARRAAQTAMGYWVPPSCDLPACGLRPHPSPLLPLAFQPFLFLPQRPPRSGPPGNAIALPD